MATCLLVSRYLLGHGPMALKRPIMSSQTGWVSTMTRQSGGRNATCNQNLGRDDGHWSRSCIFYDGRNVLTDDIKRTGHAPDSERQAVWHLPSGFTAEQIQREKISPSVWATRCLLWVISGHENVMSAWVNSEHRRQVAWRQWLLRFFKAVVGVRAKPSMGPCAWGGDLVPNAVGARRCSDRLPVATRS